MTRELPSEARPTNGLPKAYRAERGLLIVFDLDGTLIDSAQDITASASEMVTSFGGRSLEAADVAMMVGDGAAVLVRRALDTGGLDPDTPGALQRYLEIYDRRLLETTVLFAGMRDALAIAVRRARLAVLTNKPLAPTERLLDSLDVRSFFDAVIGGDGPLGRKPEPAGMRALMALAPAAPTMLVGDSPIDWHTAQAAGCAFAWARYGFGAGRFGDEMPETPYVLERANDLPAVLDRFGAVASAM